MDMKSLAQFYQIAFTHGRSRQVGASSYHFSVSRAGIVLLPSGFITACDPLVSSERQPFIQSVWPGRYPVDLAITRRDEEKEERIALARIMFTKNAPVVWVKAVAKDMNQERAGSDDEMGYAVSTGTGGFMDAETADLFQLESIADIDRILDDLMANYRPVRNWLEHPVDEYHNVILFTSGFETSSHPSFFAIDAGGDICLLVTACWTDWL